MDSKKCSKCGEVKGVEFFYKCKSTIDGYGYKCKSCEKQYKQKNKERISEYKKQYSEENKERIAEQRKQYLEDNKERVAERTKQYYQKNKEHIKGQVKQYSEDNKERVAERVKQWHQDNKEHMKQYREDNKGRVKQWNQDNKERIRKRVKQLNETDPLYKLKGNLRCRTYQAFKAKSYTKTSKTAEMLGVSYEVAKSHIERQFAKGMTWGNHGKWHIDHIMPLASAKNETELKKLCHYTNLQPLWAKDNLMKSATIISGTQTQLRM